MKCRICGVRTQNNEDICEKCYEEENSKKTKEVKSNKVLLDLKRKYKIKYMLFKSWEVFFILILAGIMTGKVLGFIVCLLLLLGVECLLLGYEKRKSKATKCKFYKNKVEYSCDFGLSKIERKINYKDLDTVNYNQTFVQKLFDFGDIYIYAKKGNLLTTGIEVKNVANLKENIIKINEIINKEEN